MNPQKSDWLKKELDELLSTEIVTECDSEWGSPALIVSKANGKIKACM